MNRLKEVAVRLCVMLVGLTIAHMGVALFLLANMGTDSFNVLVQGTFRLVQRITGWGFLTHGRVHIVMSLILVLINLILDRPQVRSGTIVCMIFGGPIIDMHTLWLEPLLGGMTDIVPRLLILVLGCFFLGYGTSIVINSRAGTGPNVLLAVVLSEKLKARYSIVRMSEELCFVIVGALLGGIFGVGTLICAFLVGPVTGYYLPKNKKLAARMLLIGGVVESEDSKT